MAISSYADLVSAVTSFMHRSDLSAQMDNFIALAESEIQTEGDALELETTAAIPVTDGTGDLPAGFLSARKLFWDGSEGRELDLVSAGRRKTVSESSSGTPTYYTIEGATIKVAPSGTGTLSMTYTARFTPLSSANTSTALLTAYPNLYLNGVLFYAAVWMEDQQKMAVHRPLFDAAIAQMKRTETRRRYPAAIAVRPR